MSGMSLSPQNMHFVTFEVRSFDCFRATVLASGNLWAETHKQTMSHRTKTVPAPLMTWKLSYRKDDRAMRPIYECPENFQEFLCAPIATFLETVMGFCSDRSCECAYKIWSS